jgi:hypothetical protein
LDLSDIDNRYYDLDDLEARSKVGDWFRHKWRKVKEVVPKILRSPTVQALGSAALTAVGNVAMHKLVGQRASPKADPAPRAPARKAVPEALGPKKSKRSMEAVRARRSFKRARFGMLTVCVHS